MNVNEQIVEIANVINKHCPDLAECYCGDIHCNYCISKALYNADYHKQRKGKNVTKNHPVDEFICSECGAIFRDTALIVVDEDDGDELYYEFAFNYCPRCGAKIDIE